MGRWGVPCLLFLACACTGPVGPAGPSGPSCSVVEVDGETKIVCDDGTEIVIPAGEPGAPCTVSDDGQGTKTITCADGTEVTVRDGVVGTPCTVTDNGDGTKTISCTDGTEVVVSDGAAGGSCSVFDNGDGSKTITCEDGTIVTIRDGEGSVPPDTELDPGEELPGLVLTIQEVAGASGVDGTFQIGDVLAVSFTLGRRDGTEVRLEHLDTGSIYVSGPTTGYQRVIARQTDLVTRSVEGVPGTYTYTFATPIPPTYVAPYNDTDSFGPDDGERTGEPLDPGTYTIGIEARQDFSLGTEDLRDVTNATTNFLFGGADTLEPREVVTDANCNSCHGELQAHGGGRRDTRLCALCHTAGAEDKNTAGVAGGTPGVSIELGVMLHRIHNARHLPSVVGVGTGDDGQRVYDVPPRPLEYIGFGDSLIDLSGATFPVFPNFNIPMPRDAGYAALTPGQQAMEDTVRTGVTDCNKCHGDPDADGPLPAPAQGDRSGTAPSRRACGSCHDDIDWDNLYIANTVAGMPGMADDDSCSVCHRAAGFSIGGSVAVGHLHPLHDITVNPGLQVGLSAVTEAAGGNADGTIDPGEKIAITFTLRDDAGADVLPSALGASMSTAVSGPTSNRNLLLNTSLPTAALAGAPPFTVNLPQPVVLEHLGDATAAPGEVFHTSRTPVWNMPGALTSVWARTATGAGTTLVADARALQNFIDVASPEVFARDAYVVLEDGIAGQEEYARVIFVDGARVWVGSPLRHAHARATSATRVTVSAKTAAVDYVVDGPSGAITEVTEMGDGNAVLASYTSDFVMPSVYGPTINDSPDLGETWGEWTGLPIQDGTYTVGLWGARAITLSLHGESNSYRGTSGPANVDFLVGAADEIVPGTIISSGARCASCHEDLSFHGGGRRGYDTCILCHGVAGGEDRARYTAANAPATTGVSIDFRSLLHKIHMGAELDQADEYQVVGFGAAAYPNNFGAIGYGEVEFPAMPGGARECSACHGESTAWQSPAERTHPDQAAATGAWAVACGSCHDSNAADAHFAVMTADDGGESCAVCHGPGSDLGVEIVHMSH
jgi:hypothetical protein